MLFSAVVVISCLVTSVVSSADIEDNVILSEDSLQDLLTRTKKSPDLFFGPKKIWNKDDKKTNARSSLVPEEESKSKQKPGSSNTDEVSAEITAVLVKDIQRKLNDLEELENSYKILKSNTSKRERTDKIKSEIDDSINSNIRSFLESKLSHDKTLDEEESIRIARQYNQGFQQYQDFYGKGIMSSEKAYSNNGRYHGLSDSSTNMYGDRGDPYLAQYNPSARTYGAAGIEGYAYGGGKEKKEHQSPLKPLKQLKQIIPNVINALAEITTPVKPSQNTVKPEYHTVPSYPVKKPEYSVHKPTSALHAPAKHEHKKGISTSPIFFSKQLIFGIGTDKKLDTKHYGNSLSEYSYPSYSYYPSGYSYYSPSSYWGPLRDDYSTGLNLYPEGTPYYPSLYSLSPDAQNIYDPSLSPYTQGNAYSETPNSQVKPYPAADSNYRSVAYRANEASPLNKNVKLINRKGPQSQLNSSPHRLQNLTLDEIESEIKKEKVVIQKIKERVENTSSKEEKETHQLSNNVKLNSTVFRRSADNEENDDGRNKVNKLCYNGNVDKNTGAFNFVEIAC